jgi:type II secretory pathway component GspD/PulD (secretin)
MKPLSVNILDVPVFSAARVLRERRMPGRSDAVFNVSVVAHQSLVAVIACAGVLGLAVTAISGSSIGAAAAAESAVGTDVPPAGLAVVDGRLQVPERRYPYVIVEQRLPEVLREFGANLGVPIEVSDKVEGIVRGPWPELTAAAFLHRLEGAFRLQSYYDGRVLHVTTAQEARSEMVRLNGVAFPDLADELDGLGLLDRSYALRPAPNGRAALVYGPPRYLELVKQTLLVLGERGGTPAPRLQSTEIIRGYTAEQR